MYYAPENPMYDPYYGKYVHGHDIRSARVYEPDELPFWLAIGHICWRATYRKGYRYFPKMIVDIQSGPTFPGKLSYLKEATGEFTEYPSE